MTGRLRLRSLLLSFAMLSAAGFHASVWAANADDTVDQTAMAIPRIGMPGARSVALPQPLSSADAARVRRIFSLQRAGSIADATREMDGLGSDLLRGTILAQRYLDTAYIPRAEELSAWLERFGDQPEAPAIRTMLETSQPIAHDSGAPAVPGPRFRPGQSDASNIPARDLLTQNQDRAAMRAAMSLLAGGPPNPKVADSLFAGGVAAWRLEDLLTAKPLFEAAWRGGETAALRAAAAFWTARVAQTTRDRASRLFWLRRAAREDETFYGPIARHALNPIGPCLASPFLGKQVLTNADVDTLMTTEPGRRSFALLQVGERVSAEAEMRALWVEAGSQPSLGRSLILVAKAVGLTRFADGLRDETNVSEAVPGRFELPMLRPSGGFRMDPAFVYAVVRHESNFHPLAVSPAGARGLMQVMPATAAGIGAIGYGQSDRLNDPSINLDVGQRYLIQLADNPLVGDDLLKLIAAYGQGPGGMSRWAALVRAHGDPFVFLEAIPSPFMRQFVEDVLVYHWQYAAALRVRASSLDDLATGTYPRFTPIKATPDGTKAPAASCPNAELKG